MLVKDPDIATLIERISEHYRSNISNRYIRPALLLLPLDGQTWDRIDSLTERSELYRFQGAHLDELYHQVIACSRFVASARRELAPSIRSRLAAPSSSSADRDRILRDMAINNFSSNLTVFADLVNELYVRLVDFDKRNARGKAPVYPTMPELQNVGTNLVG